jgi:hypothetical protein
MSADTKTAEAINFPDAPTTMLLRASDQVMISTQIRGVFEGMMII